jgi:hypothetical protein
MERRVSFMSNDDAREIRWVGDQFRALMSAKTPAQRTAYLLEHPVLLSGTAQALLQRVTAGDAVSEGALAELDDLRSALGSHPDRYPAGHGPLERIVAELRSGDIDLQEAVERAKAPDCAGQLSYAYIKALLSRLGNEADDDLTFALAAAETALEAALAMPWPLLAPDVRRGAAQGFIPLVHRGLLRRPDGRLFARAIEVGEWAVRDAEEHGQGPMKGNFLHWLGTMSLDAYGSKFAPSPEFPAQIEEWLGRALDPMPTPVDGLSRARHYLSQAVELRPPGRERGQTLKALVEAMLYEGYARGTAANLAEVSTLADQAIAQLDPDADAATIVRVNELRRRVAAT